jgi:hypothetical protein
MMLVVCETITLLTGPEGQMHLTLFPLLVKISVLKCNDGKLAG